MHTVFCLVEMTSIFTAEHRRCPFLLRQIFQQHPYHKQYLCRGKQAAVQEDQVFVISFLNQIHVYLVLVSKEQHVSNLSLHPLIPKRQCEYISTFHSFVSIFSD